MDLLMLIIFIPAVIALFAAFFISSFARKKLSASGKNYVKTISILIFIGSSVLIFSAIIALIAYNIRFER